MAIPQAPAMFNALLTALHGLGGSASIEELEQGVAKVLNLSDGDLAVAHDARRSEFSYRLAWARTHLKRFGLLENSARGIWALTAQGQHTGEVESNSVMRHLRELDRSREEAEDTGDAEGVNQRWEDEVLESIKAMAPEAFERLSQRLLRESGFIQVEVTGRSGDGGIDGRGVVKLASILSFHVHFQCKRYKDSVGASVIRDFRGAMVGRADKGIIITTGSFTRDAKTEALRDGAPPLDLVDGEDMVQMLKKYNLGITTKQRITEEVLVDRSWFATF
jgi:restriction system protein